MDNIVFFSELWCNYDMLWTIFFFPVSRLYIVSSGSSFQFFLLIVMATLNFIYKTKRFSLFHVNLMKTKFSLFNTLREVFNSSGVWNFLIKIFFIAIHKVIFDFFFFLIWEKYFPQSGTGSYFFHWLHPDSFLLPDRCTKQFILCILKRDLSGGRCTFMNFSERK